MPKELKDKLDLDELTIREAKQLAAMFGSTQTGTGDSPYPHPYTIGANYLIRTVTMIDTGKLVGVTEHELVLEDAAWIADTGRFSDNLKSCQFSEVEPFPEGKVIVGRGSVIDVVEIVTLPRKQK